jgi:hypothetical protein
MAYAKIVLVLLLASVGSSAARCLHQHSQGQLAGRKFSFDRDGGASTYLQKLQQDQPQVLQQVLTKAAKVLPGEAGRSAAAVTRKGQLVGASSASAQDQEQAAVEVLAKHLDQDNGLVSARMQLHGAMCYRLTSWSTEDSVSNVYLTQSGSETYFYLQPLLVAGRPSRYGAVSL